MWKVAMSESDRSSLFIAGSPSGVDNSSYLIGTQCGKRSLGVKNSATCRIDEYRAMFHPFYFVIGDQMKKRGMSAGFVSGVCRVTASLSPSRVSRETYSPGMPASCLGGSHIRTRAPRSFPQCATIEPTFPQPAMPIVSEAGLNPF